MSYTEFKQELYLEMSQRREIAGKQIRYLTTERKDVLCIIWERRGVWKVLHWNVEMLYQRFCADGLQSVIPELVFRVLLCERTQSRGKIENEAEKTAQKAVLHPMNYAVNQEQLRDAVFWQFGDIVLSLHILLQTEKGECHTMQLDREQAERQGVPHNILLFNAMIRSCMIFPPRLYHGSDIRHYHAETAGIFMPEEQGEYTAIHNEDKQEGRQGYRLTVAGGKFGAMALFYPGVQTRLAELLEGDYYVGFINVHEAVIHPVRCKPLGEMRDSLMHIHAVTDERELLSSKIYRYREEYEVLVEI